MPGPAGALRCEVFVPPTGTEPLPLTIYLHGGGCVLLDPEAYRPLCSYLASRSRSIVVAPAYRLAPEAPFPAALDDACAVYAWALRHADEIAADRRRIALCGDSAGGYLATGITLAAKARGLPQPRCQILAYPNTDMSGDWPSYHRPELAEMLHEIRWLTGLYAGSHAGDPRASPLRAADHRGLAPAVILAAEYDPLVDQGRAYAHKLAQAEVQVAYILYGGAPHGFLSMAGAIDLARIARSHLAATLAHRLGT